MINDDSSKLDKPLRVLLAKWMAAYSEIHNKQVTREKLEVYIALLADIPLQELSAALTEAGKTCERFPTPADIREFVTKQNHSREIFSAEEEWLKVKRTFEKFWHPDIGVYKDAPKLSAVGEYALRHIGGFKRFATSLIADENWIRREFLEACSRFEETGGRLAPTRDEAKKLLAGLNTALEERNDSA